MPLLLDEQIRQNRRRTVWLFIHLVAVILGMGLAIGLQFGAPWWIAAAMTVVAAALYVTITVALAMRTIVSAARARPANPAVRPEKLLIYAVEEMAVAAGLPMPKVYVQEDGDINAFAAGRRPEAAMICVSQGALAALTQEELQGVIAHEMAHIRNQDVRVVTYAVALVGFVALVFDMSLRASRGRGKKPIYFLGVVALAGLAYFLSRLTYFAISRQREYLADASGAELTRNPEGLRSALLKIAARQPTVDRGDRTVAALYLDNPFRRLRRNSVWSTHPPLARRVERLGGRFEEVAPRRGLAAPKVPAASRPVSVAPRSAKPGQPNMAVRATLAVRRATCPNCQSGLPDALGRRGATCRACGLVLA